MRCLLLLLAGARLLCRESSCQQQPPPGNGSSGMISEISPLVQDELDQCGEALVDAHLHLSPWFGSNATPLVGEMMASGITQGVIMAVYGFTNPFGTDPNKDVAGLVDQSQGILFGLASLNTTGDWNETRDTELERLGTFLSRDGFVGAKLAPPHTCLPLDSGILQEIVATVASSSRPVLGIHIGTTPFCGPFADQIIGTRGCCGQEYVDPYLMEPLIQSYSQVTFVLMHAGFDFLEPTNENYYNGTFVDASIEIALANENVYLEISAFLKQENGTYRPLALESLQKMANAGLANRLVYGSDANHYPGQLLPYLNSTIEALRMTGFSSEEGCAILTSIPRKAYGFEARPAPMSPTSAPVEPTPGEDAPTTPDTGDTQQPVPAPAPDSNTPQPTTASSSARIRSFGSAVLATIMTACGAVFF